MSERKRIKETLSYMSPIEIGRSIKKGLDSIVTDKLAALGFMDLGTFRAQRNLLDDMEDRVNSLEKKLDSIELILSKDSKNQF